MSEEIQDIEQEESETTFFEQDNPQPAKQSTEPAPGDDLGAGNGEGLLSGWSSETKIPDGGREFKTPEPEKGEDKPGSSEEKPGASEPSAQETALDDQTVDILADAATNTNDELMAGLLKWLHGNQDKSAYKANTEAKGNIKKAWKLIIQKLKWQPSTWDAILFANFAAYGWSLIGGVITAAGRFAKGTLTWPWKKAKETFRRPDVETVKPDQQQQPDPAPQMQVVKEPEQPAQDEDEANFTMKRCLQTGHLFREGYGSPKRSKDNPELVDSFVNISAYTTYCNKHGLKGRGKKKTEKK